MATRPGGVSRLGAARKLLGEPFGEGGDVGVVVGEGGG